MSNDKDESRGIVRMPSATAEERRDSTNTKDDTRIAAVMFVENTKGGVLAKNLRKVMERIKGILGYKVKIVERAGIPLKLMFPLSNVGQGGQCGKSDCITCTQESRVEVLPPCSKRSVVYENICIKCNPGVVEGEKMKKF